MSASETPPPDQDLPIWVDSVLDDAGLSKLEFRLIGHIRRRGDCRASVETMAKFCGTNRNKVHECLQNLEDRLMITKQSVIGEPSVYWVNPTRFWVSRVTKRLQGVGGGVTKRLQGVYPIGDRGCNQTVTQRTSHEGTPFKALPCTHGEVDGKCIGDNALKAAGKKEKKPLTASQLELWAEVEELVPGAARHIFPALLESQPDTLRRAAAECRERFRRHPPIVNPGGYLIDTFRRFGGKIPSRKAGSG